MLNFLLAGLLATSVKAQYDLSGVDWSKVDYSGGTGGGSSGGSGGGFQTTGLPFFVLWGTGPVSSQRLDPIMAAGQTPSQHMHEFMGANVVSPGMTGSDIVSGATCSSFQAKADSSSYWNPGLFFHNPKTGEYTQVPSKQGNSRKVYYSYKTFAGQLQPGIKEFPTNFKMITGDPMATTAEAVQACPNAECGFHQMGGKVATWTCQDANGGGATVTGFPKGFSSCPGGLRGQVMFPDCWNGQEFDAANPHAHMAFSTGDGVEGCPSTHRSARFPQIFLEASFDISSFDGQYSASDSPFVLAFGDKTGFGWHMDFLNGWKQGALDAVMKTCRLGDGSNPQTLADQSCFGQVGGMYTQAEVDACQIQSAPGIKVAVKNNALPGCQTLTGVGSKVDLKTCPNTVATASGGIVGRSILAKRLAAGHGRFIEVDA